MLVSSLVQTKMSALTRLLGVVLVVKFFIFGFHGVGVFCRYFFRLLPSRGSITPLLLSNEVSDCVYCLTGMVNLMPAWGHV